MRICLISGLILWCLLGCVGCGLIRLASDSRLFTGVDHLNSAAHNMANPQVYTGRPVLKGRRLLQSGGLNIVTFSYTGSVVEWQVPDNVYKLNIKMWGAGGGGGSFRSVGYAGAFGGAGGYSEGTIPVTPRSYLYLAVGGGGSGGKMGTQPGAFPNGGGHSRAGSVIGMGGGRSQISVFSSKQTVFAAALRVREGIKMIAGAGGGGSYTSNVGFVPVFEAALGRAGGGVVGSQSLPYNRGGTQNLDMSCPNISACSGVISGGFLQGAHSPSGFDVNAFNFAPGGDGYYGGSSGMWRALNGNLMTMDEGLSSGGGGGSGFIHPSVINGSSFVGNDTTHMPQNFNDPINNGMYGVGGSPYNDAYLCADIDTRCHGKNGFIQLTYSVLPICPAGFHLNADQTSCVLCANGFYCLAGSISGISCSVGSYCPTGSTTENPCSAGSYCVNPATQVICPANYYCPINSTTPSACLGDRTSLPNSTTPDQCTCPSVQQSVVNNKCTCPVGTRLAGGNCVTCPSGIVCAESSEAAICSSGSYCPSGSTDENPCQAGHYCATPATQVLCSFGSYCPEGSISEQSCIVGHYCVNTTSILPCPLGSYCVGSNTASVPCQAGSYCATPSIQAQCPANFYCPMSSIEPIICPDSKVSQPGSSLLSQCEMNEMSLAVTIYGANVAIDQSQLQAALPEHVAVGSYHDEIVSAQNTCPVGFYCPPDTTTPIACPGGTYNNFTSQDDISDCVVCPAGQFCPIHSVLPTDCAAGSYLGTTGGVSQDSCSTCPAGYYCPTASITPTACFSGTYNPNTGRDLASDCQICDIGRYSLTLASPSNCPLCQANSYCPNLTSIKSCPHHTVSTEGSSTLLHCRCEKGFVCSYTKTITAVITLNTTLSSFNDPSNPVRGAFINAVSVAAGVSASHVTINEVKATLGSRRLLSTTPDSNSTDQFITVHTSLR